MLTTILNNLQKLQKNRPDAYFESEKSNQVLKGFNHIQTLGNGFISYSHSGTTQNLTANTWTNLLNDGEGFNTTRDTFAPKGVTKLLDISTGFLDLTQLSVGDVVLVRNDYTITPSIDNALLEFRYEVESINGVFTLPKSLGRMDTGAGVEYRYGLDLDYIYIGSEIVKNTPIKLQIRVSEDSVVKNGGTIVHVLKLMT